MIFSIPVHTNIALPKVFSPFSSFTFLRLLQYPKTVFPIFSMLAGTNTLSRPLQSEKASAPSDFRFSGNITSLRLSHASNAFFPILSRVSGNSAVSASSHFLNVLSPISVIPSCMTIDFIPLYCPKPETCGLLLSDHNAPVPTISSTEPLYSQ